MESCGLNSISSCSGLGSSSAANGQSNLRNGQQRKQRRCWSPELHRRFVNALQQLGGAQAATPKQIRDLMQVDGLTNDEVKRDDDLMYGNEGIDNEAATSAGKFRKLFVFSGNDYLGLSSHPTVSRAAIKA
ncbi:HTH myb-type domain-containing protein [Abeliophyllum distichum]|uniref:HTH myb-type domain-containing protein n=1 Tax=Abeliophyllum distichum TaxID=126358 RepID=A0ABD1V5G9_9LAMI